MIRDQLYLFEEHNPFNTTIKNVDYVDIQTLPYDPQRKKYSHIDLQYSALPKNTYIVFKTGGVHSLYKDKGAVFPYVKNIVTGKVLTFNSGHTDLYPKFSMQTVDQGPIYARIHRVLGLAFLPNSDLQNEKHEWVVGHKDDNVFNYRIENLIWLTQQQNQQMVGNRQEKSDAWKKNLEKIK